MVPSGFVNIAHRGASAYAPENTFSAFDKALSLGVDQVELDVHFSEDGHIVVIHDDNLVRTTNGSGPVSAHSLAQLRSLDAGSWFGPEYAGERIRSLGEVLERYKGRLYLHIEIKAQVEGLTQRTVDLVRGYGMVDSVSIISFQEPRLIEVRAYAPEIPAGWLVGNTNIPNDATAASVMNSEITRQRFERNRRSDSQPAVTAPTAIPTGSATLIHRSGESTFFQFSPRKCLGTQLSSP